MTTLDNSMNGQATSNKVLSEKVPGKTSSSIGLSNGKRTTLDRFSAGIMPSSLLLDKLRLLWGQVLKVESHDINSNDNFIWLGGDSVAVIGLSSAARSAGLSLSFDSILKAPVLSDMVL
jgi:aryl carrier-like protein